MSRTWSSPNPPKIWPWNMSFVRKSRRLHYFQLSADIQGLIVCCSDSWNSGIYPFSGISKAFKEYIVKKMKQQADDSDTKIYWMFFPINAGGFIEKAWIRHFKNSAGKCPLKGPEEELFKPILVVSLGQVPLFFSV